MTEDIIIIIIVPARPPPSGYWFGPDEVV